MNLLFVSYAMNHCCGVSRHIAALGTQLLARGHQVAIAGPGGTLMPELEASGWHRVAAPIDPSRKSPATAWRAMRQLSRSVEALDIDVIHSHQRWAELLAVGVARLTRVPSVMTCHSLVRGRRLVSYRSDRVIAVSAATEQLLRDHFAVPASRLRLVNNVPRAISVPTPDRIAAFRTQLGLASSDIAVVAAGRFHHDKGFDVLLEAAARLAREAPDIKLVIVGTGQGARSLQARAGRDRLPVVFPGELAEMGLAYSVADIVAVPSRTESSGLVPMEAAQFSKPVVATAVGGLRELFRTEGLALLVPPEDPVALASALRQLAADASARTCLGDALHRHVAMHYSAAAHVEAVERVYRELAG